jgi:hypothetical protein
VVDDLERHPLADLRVLGQEHHAHPAHADARQDPVVTEGLAGG